MVVAAGILAVAAGYGVKVTAQTGQSPEPIAALLAEVHALRIAMEQSATGLHGSASMCNPARN